MKPEDVAAVVKATVVAIREDAPRPVAPTLTAERRNEIVVQSLTAALERLGNGWYFGSDEKMPDGIIQAQNAIKAILKEHL